jgi:hypothetical protein
MRINCNRISERYQYLQEIYFQDPTQHNTAQHLHWNECYFIVTVSNKFAFLCLLARQSDECDYGGSVFELLKLDDISKQVLVSKFPY